MRLETTAGQLRSALSAFRGVIDSRQTIPVLETVKFENGYVYGTDLDMEVSVALPVVGSFDGATCVDWRSLWALARCLDDDTISLGEEDGLVTATFNGSHYKMPSVAASDYPEFAMPDAERSASGNLGLVAAMSRIRFAISREETRYYLNGVAILNDPDGSKIIVATNGHQLALMPLDGAPDTAVGAIIPSRVVHYLCHRKREPEHISFATEKPRARFDFPGLTLAAKLIDGTFPDIFRVIPSDASPVLSVDRVKLWHVLIRMRDFIGGRFRAVKLSIEPGRMTLSAAGFGGEVEAVEHIEVDGVEKPAEGGFNIDYLVTIMSTLRGDRVTFSVGQDFASCPCVITSDGDPLKIVQMTMRV